ncbi:MAG: DUF1570 domain-containing protein [Planctomycetes bacterium]|nr:DUF1570 domain-containing protein [Planctomycetota bacterium]
MSPLLPILVAMLGPSLADGAGAALATRSEVLEATRPLVPTMQPTETDHFVLLSDAPKENTQSIAGLLESTYRSFQQNCLRLGVRPEPLKHKLVAVMFREKGDYSVFARTNDGMDRAWAAGYYNPGADRLVLFDGLSDEKVQKTLGQLQAQNLRVQREAAAAGVQPLDADGQVARVQREIDAQRRRVAATASAGFLGTVSHEAAHQLFFHCDVQRRGVPYPLWLAEGIATAFEAENASDRDLGFQSENSGRQQTFREAMREDRLVPLQALVIAEGMPTDGEEDAIRDFYAQSWAFTTWLARHRTREFTRYLEVLRSGAFALPTKRVETFESIFGPIDAVERCWLREEIRREPGLAETAWGRKLADFRDGRPVRRSGGS